MPRPKKTTPTVATTEPDTNLNPDRAQVAAVADLPHAPRIVVDSIPEGAPVTVARVMHEIPPGSGGPTLESILAAKDATIAEQSARIASLTGWGQRCEEEISRKDDRIAELEAKADPPGWRESRAYRDGLALDDIRCAILDTGHPLGDDSDPELTPLRLVREVLAKVAEPALPPSPADLIAGYRAVASGQVKAAEWKGRRLVRLHGNPEPIAMYDHPEPPPGCMPSGFVAEVASGTTRIMSPPLKDEAEARAWCEARCGWTVVQ